MTISALNESDFGCLLRELWEAKGLGQVNFARVIRRSEAYVSRVRTGGIPPPNEDEVARWAHALDLAPADRVRLLDAAALANTPERIRRKFLQLAMAAVL